MYCTWHFDTHVVLYMAMWNTCCTWHCKTHVLYMALWYTCCILHGTVRHMLYCTWYCETHVFYVALWDTWCIVHGTVRHVLYCTWYSEARFIVHGTVRHVLYMVLWDMLYCTWCCETHVLYKVHTASLFEPNYCSVFSGDRADLQYINTQYGFSNYRSFETRKNTFLHTLNNM